MKYNLMLTIIFMVYIFLTPDVLAQDSLKTNQVKTKTGNLKQIQKKHGQRFVDKDGDGYNDNAPDHDGDGIPNGLDEDYLGVGKKGFIDLDGDGINDNAGVGKGKRNSFRTSGYSNKKGFGSHNGSANGVTNNSDGSTMGNTGKTRKGKNGKGGH